MMLILRTNWVGCGRVQPRYLQAVVVLTYRVSTVAVAARDSRGIASNDFIVALFPVGDVDRQGRAVRQRTIRPDPDGTFRIRTYRPATILPQTCRR
jgi:hypothetical protein